MAVMAYAQDANIVGHVVDKATGEHMPVDGRDRSLFSERPTYGPAYRGVLLRWIRKRRACIVHQGK